MDGNPQCIFYDPKPQSETSNQFVGVYCGLFSIALLG